MVAAQEAAAWATSSSVSRASPSGRNFAITDWKRKKSWCWRSVRPLMLGSRTATSASCCRRTTAAGCSRDAARYGQSDGQSISISRLVPQQTEQIDRPRPGQLRFALRCWQRGQAIARKLYTPPQRRQRLNAHGSHSRQGYGRVSINLHIDEIQSAALLEAEWTGWKTQGHPPEPAPVFA